jgi:Lrp/AsnC family transcriptional regulator, leucine-responsive regulatory protein
MKKASSKAITLDHKDKQILEVLYKDSRTPVTKISTLTGIPKDSIIYRIKKLREHEIARFATILDPKKFGFPIFKFVNFVFYTFSPALEQQFFLHCRAHKNIIYSAKTSGSYDYTIAIAAKDLDEYESVMRDLRTKFSKLIKEFHSVDIITEDKYEYSVDLID